MVGEENRGRRSIIQPRDEVYVGRVVYSADLTVSKYRLTDSNLSACMAVGKLPKGNSN